VKQRPGCPVACDAVHASHPWMLYEQAP